MTPASVSSTESLNDIITRNMITPPPGWVVAGEVSANGSGDATDMTQLKINLQLAGHEALQLINAIRRQAEVEIPEAYLRVEKETIFHLLLLVSRPDFLSPKLVEGKILVEDYVKNKSKFDMRVSFGNIEENTHKNEIIEHGYKLMHTGPDNV